ncbi:MAG: DedA family protein [Candidatus Sungbacteria bacterium]|nr:DedA family protein [Candidatus Sungbacteria bacterium]
MNHIHLRFLHRLYHWTLKWASHPRASLALFGIAFIESSFFLIPPDILLIAMTIAKPRRWAWYAAIATIGSVLGGIFGYIIGAALWESIGKAIVQFYHFESVIKVIQENYQAHAFVTIFTAAFTPIPYKVITIAAGLFRVSLLTLIAASLIGRGLRFGLVAALLGFFGERMKQLIERYFDMLSLLFAILLIGGFLLITLLV